jgi:hypothetical protein
MASFLLLALAHFLASLGFVFLSPEHLFARYVLFFLILPLLAFSIRNADALYLGDFFSMYAFGFGLYAHYFLCILRLAAPRATINNAKELRLERWYWACGALFTPRRELLETPQMHAQMHESRGRFLLRESWKLMLCISTYTILDKVPILIAILGRLPDFSSKKDSLFTYDTTVDDLITRAYVAGCATLIPYCILRGAFSFSAIFSIAVLGTPYSQWQTPLFGPISSAWSLRRWFNGFWYKLMRKGFTVNASWFVERYLGLTRGTVASRIAILLVSFAMSGIMHAAAAWSIDRHCGSGTRVLWYNLALALAIIVEDIVQRIYVLVLKEMGFKRNTCFTKAERIVGYCWVALWFVEALPRVWNPNIRCSLIRYSQQF